MSSLLDLGPLTEEVEIRGVKLTVHGLTVTDLFKLFSEFPDMQKLLAQMGTPNAVMLGLAPDMFAKVIAMATGSLGDKEVEERAKQLGAADQLMILSAVQRMSFPQGFGPFVDQMTRLVGTGMTTATSSETLNGQANSSRAPSSAQLQTDSPGMLRGASPRGN
jgi:hypothetical protein